MRGWSGVSFAAAEIDGRRVQLLGTEPGAGLAPPLLAGRGLGAKDEIVLGSKTARELGKGIGDTVAYRGDGEPVALRVVGIATLPAIGAVHDTHPSLGLGALVTDRALLPTAVAPPDPSEYGMLVGEERVRESHMSATERRNAGSLSTPTMGCNRSRWRGKHGRQRRPSATGRGLRRDGDRRETTFGVPHEAPAVVRTPDYLPDR